MLEINNLTVEAENKTILNNFNLKINDGEIHVLMGPNGTGKSTICKAILKHPDYKVTGKMTYHDQDLLAMDTTSIARLGFFYLNQNPVEIEGITNAEMLRNALSEKNDERVDIFKFNKKLNEVCDIINLPKSFVHRDINYNMSGGEKKKNELLQLFILEPKFIILDEIDSGLDVDALKTVGKALQEYYERYKPSILIVTHHQAILKYFNDYTVHVLKDGKIKATGDKSLATKIENLGFEANTINGTTEYE